MAQNFVTATIQAPTEAKITNNGEVFYAMKSKIETRTSRFIQKIETDK